MESLDLFRLPMLNILAFWILLPFSDTGVQRNMRFWKWLNTLHEYHERRNEERSSPQEHLPKVSLLNHEENSAELERPTIQRRPTLTDFSDMFNLWNRRSSQPDIEMATNPVNIRCRQRSV